jgi:RNA polymerase sigma-70 factor (ECF subfamily)
MVVDSCPGDTAIRVARERQCAVCLKQVAEGDTEALGALYDLTASLLHSLLLRILRETSEAEEVLLDVYMEVWKKAASFEASRGSATSWLVMLARSRALDRLRSTAGSRRREVPLPPESRVEPSQQEGLLAMEQQRLIQEALAQLADGQRQAIELAFYEGLTHAEIAQRLRQPLGTIKTRIRLGMAKLRTLLGGLVLEPYRGAPYDG